jgi:hypothetical protein
MALIHVLMVTATVHAENTSIGVILPYFEGEGWLAKNVPTVIFLQLWPTLRKAPFPNPQKLDFGDGIMRWAVYPLDPPGHLSAEKLARDANVQMTLWGSAMEYGGGVVVQTYLSIPRYDDGRKKHNELWSVPFRLDGRDYRVEADIPNRYYEFAPISLSRKIVATYSSPGALKLYREKSMKTEIGPLGDGFEAIRYEGDKILVETDDNQGWINLPALSTQQNEVIDFTGGLIRIYRGDWNGAIALMNKVVKNSNAPTSLKVDAYLYTAYAKVKLGNSPTVELGKARELSPNSSAVVVYTVMNDLEQLSRQLKNSGKPSAAAKKMARKIQDNLKENGYLFPEDSIWLKSVTEVVESIR